MSSKMDRLRAERSKNDEKIAALRIRNAEIDKQITELENLNIIGMVRSVGMTPEQLAVIIRQAHGAAPDISEEEVVSHEE